MIRHLRDSAQRVGMFAQYWIENHLTFALLHSGRFAEAPSLLATD
jgi:hypothetical protein